MALEITTHMGRTMWMGTPNHVSRHRSTHYYGGSQHQQTTGDHDRYYTVAIYNIFLGLGDLLLLPCINMDKSQRHCFLFYIYGWFFGLGLGAISTIYCFVDNDTVASRILMVCAVFFSVIIAIIQIALFSWGRTKFGKQCRYISVSVIRIGGLLFVMIVTLAGTFSSNDPGGLFFICAIFSFACYLMACIGFSVRFCRERREFQRNSEQSGEDRMRDSSIHVVYPNWVPDLSVVYHHDDEFVQIGTSNNNSRMPPNQFYNINGEPLPILNLPTYSEAVGERVDSVVSKPPEYSDSVNDSNLQVSDEVPSYTMLPSQGETSTDSQYNESLTPEEDGLPPQYNDVVPRNDVVRGRFWAL